MRLPGQSPGPVTAAFAGVLDGRALWLAVALDEVDEGWSFALRDESGALTPLGGERQGGHLATIADLPTAPASYDVLVARGDDSRPIVALEPPPGPTRTPDRGPVAFGLVYGEGGLRLTATVRQEAAEVLALGTDGTRLTFTVTGDRGELIFVQDRVDLGSVPLEAGSRGLTAAITAADVPGSHVRLVVADDERRRPVRRAANGLIAAGPAVLLPRLEDAEGEPILVANWHAASGNLRLRRPSAG